MLLAPDENTKVARLFSFLMLGEQVAHDCARAQTKIVTDSAMRRFLRAQVRQEAFHTKVFECGVLWLVPRGIRRCPALAPMNAYRRRLEETLGDGNFAETLLAQQVLLEGLGDVVFNRINQGMTDRGLGFTRLRRIILRQEHTHHTFGVRCLEKLIAMDDTLVERLRAAFPEYLILIEAMLDTLQGLFEFFDEEPGHYMSELQGELPDWLGQAQGPKTY